MVPYLFDLHALSYSWCRISPRVSPPLYVCITPFHFFLSEKGEASSRRKSDPDWGQSKVLTCYKYGLPTFWKGSYDEIFHLCISIKVHQCPLMQSTGFVNFLTFLFKVRKKFLPQVTVQIGNKAKLFGTYFPLQWNTNHWQLFHLSRNLKESMKNSSAASLKIFEKSDFSLRNGIIV
jgi:hypothetical protein